VTREQWWQRPERGTKGYTCVNIVSSARHEGSTGQWGLAVWKKTVLNLCSWIFLDTAPYLVQIEN